MSLIGLRWENVSSGQRFFNVRSSALPNNFCTPFNLKALCKWDLNRVFHEEKNMLRTHGQTYHYIAKSGTKINTELNANTLIKESHTNVKQLWNSVDLNLSAWCNINGHCCFVIVRAIGANIIIQYFNIMHKQKQQQNRTQHPPKKKLQKGDLVVNNKAYCR